VAKVLRAADHGDRCVGGRSILVRYPQQARKSALNRRQTRRSHPALWELERSTDYELQCATASLEGNPSSPHSHTAACARVIGFDGHGSCFPARLFTASRSL
jgi:hypothetical protein